MSDRMLRVGPCAAFVLLSWCSVFAGEALVDRWQYHRDAAQRAARDGDWQLANQSYEQAVRHAELIEDDALLIRTLRDWVTAYEQQHRFDLAIEAQTRVVQLQDRNGSTPSLEHARSVFVLAQLERTYGEPQAAEALFRRALDMRRRLDSPAYPTTGLIQRELGRAIQVQRPDDPEVADLLRRRADDERTAIAWQELGNYWTERDDPDAALAAYRRAAEIEEGRLVPNRRLLAQTLLRLGRQQMLLGEIGLAESALVRAVELREQELGPDHPSLTHTLRGLAEVYVEDQRYLEAEQVLLRIELLDQAAWGERDHECSCQSRDLMARVQHALGRDAEPRTGAETTAKAESVEADPLAEQIELLEQQAAELRKRRRYAEANDELLDALALREQRWGPDSPGMLEGLQALAQLRRLQGDPADAIRQYERSLAIIEGRQSLDPRWLAATLNRLGSAYASLRQHDLAEQAHVRELQVRESLGHRLLAARAMESLARIGRSQRDFEMAAEYHRAAAELWREFAGDRAPEIATNLAGLARDYIGLQRHSEAEQLLLDLLESEEADDAHPDDLLKILHPLAALYRQQASERRAEVELRIEQLNALKSSQ